MEISLEWINELTSIKPHDLESLIEKLTLGGFEVESTNRRQIDSQDHVALDLTITANRADSLSIKGIAFEIAALLNQPRTDSKYLAKTNNWVSLFRQQEKLMEKPTGCRTFFALTVENINTFSSPKWLQYKLSSSGISPENNFRDFQNYIQLETGYPFEFYDLDKIQDKITATQDFVIRIACVNNIKQIFVNDISIGILGITPHKDLECSSQTQTILLEGSIFDAAAVRRQSRIVGLKTNRSIRYERALNNSNLVTACYRLISLLRINNPNLKSRLHTNSNRLTLKPTLICLDYQTIKNVLGPIKGSSVKKLMFIPIHHVTESLCRLGLNPDYDPALKVWNITVPAARHTDLENEIDLIEEIGRLYGFDNFLTQLPKLKHIGSVDASYKIRKKLTNGLLNMGLTEFVHYSLVNANMPTQKSHRITLINPLVSEYSSLRADLLPSLIQTLTTNWKQGNLLLDGFEYSHVFSRRSSGARLEREVVGGFFGAAKVKSPWVQPNKVIEWFEAKGHMEHLFHQLRLNVSWKTENSRKLSSSLHPYRTSLLVLDENRKLGIFGQIHPITAKRLNLPQELYLFELDFELIRQFSNTSGLTVVKAYSTYPKIVKNLSFLISDDIPFEKLQKLLYLNGTAFLTQIHLLDRYRGSAVQNGYTSLCIQLVFQSNKQTLQNKQIETVVQNLNLALEQNFNVHIR